MKKLYLLVGSILIFFLALNIVEAHPGRTDSSGCHVCRTNCAKWGYSTGSRHCHNGGSNSSVSKANRRTYAKTYVKPVAKPVIKSSNNNIKEIKVDGISAIKTEEHYELKTYNKKVNVLVYKEHPKAVSLNKQSYILEKYKNEIPIVIKAENGNVKQNNLIIYKINNNTYLKKLKVEGYKFKFKKDKKTYKLKKKFFKSKIKITAKPASKLSKVKIKKPKNVNKKKNVYKITVTAIDGSKRVYKIIVNK